MFKQIFLKLKALLFFLTILMYIQLFINFSFKWSQKPNNLDNILFTYDYSSNKYCATNGDWILFNYSNYFRKQSCYFFIDASLIIAYVLHNSKNMPNFKYILQNNANKSQKFEIDLIKTVNLPKDLLNGQYRLSGLFFSVRNENISIDPNSSYVLTVETNKSSVDLYLKNKLLKIDQKAKKDLLICTKLFFNNKNKLDEYREWIKINKLFGVDQIQAYKIANDLEEKFDSISLKNVNCIPNLFKNEKNKSDNDFFFKPPDFLPFYKKMDLINELLINECYLDNIDKYKFVLVTDTDEIMLPKLDNDTKIVSKKNNTQVPSYDLGTYIQSFDWNHKSNLFFEKKTSLSNYAIEQMCSKLKKFDIFPQNFNVFEHNMKFKFKASSQEEYKYGIHLCDLYYNIIKVNNFKSPFGKFFMVGSKKGGKSVHSTDKTIIFTTHKVFYDYSFGNKKFFIYQSKSNVVTEENLIHFRPTCKHLALRKINIREIVFNDNYFSFFTKYLNN